MPQAMARSSSAPSLRSSAGDRLMTMARVSSSPPRWRIAASTRSRASRPAASGSPTTASAGVPGRASTSTCTRSASTPRGTAEKTRVTMNHPLRGNGVVDVSIVGAGSGRVKLDPR